MVDDADDIPIEVLVKRANSLALADNAAAINSNGRGNRVNEIDYENETVNAVSPWRKARNTYLNRKPTKGYLTRNGICNYHDRYGSFARSCVEGCQWIAKNGMSGRRQ